MYNQFKKDIKDAENTIKKNKQGSRVIARFAIQDIKQSYLNAIDVIVEKNNKSIKTMELTGDAYAATVLIMQNDYLQKERKKIEDHV